MAAHGKRNTAAFAGCVAWLLLSLPVAAEPLPFDRSIDSLVRNGVLTPEEAEVLQSPSPQPMQLTPAQRNPVYPFNPTPDGFKRWLKAQGVRVISVADCSANRTDGTDGKSPEQPLPTPTRITYQCNRVFFDATDPRGIQRCMGRFFWSNLWNGGGVYETTLKNDCRWLS